MIKDLMHDNKEHMEKAVESLQTDLMALRTGRASPALLERVRVEYFGAPTPLNQLATISAPEPRLLTIKPWDTRLLPAIEKALMKSDLGLTPEQRRPDHPPQYPSPDRRAPARSGQAREQASRRGQVALRNIRRDGQEDLREMEKEKMISEDELFEGKEELQKMTDSFIKGWMSIGKAKEDEIMEV